MLCPQDVSDSKVKRLREDGATVEIVANIHEHRAKPAWEIWADVMTKLHILEMTEFEEVLLLDGDMHISKRLVDIFNDSTTQPLPLNQDLATEDEGPLPKSYVFSAQTMTMDREHPYPYPPGEHMSAGFKYRYLSCYMSQFGSETTFERAYFLFRDQYFFADNMTGG